MEFEYFPSHDPYQPTPVFTYVGLGLGIALGIWIGSMAVNHLSIGATFGSLLGLIFGMGVDIHRCRSRNKHYLTKKL